MLTAFTVDVEDYFHVSAFERSIPRSTWGGYESRVVASTQRLLELLARRNVRGTFFMLGWVADRFPSLVREIADAGHELASHSYWHRLVYELTPDEFRADLRRSKQAIEDACGIAITMFRAPSFSITVKSLWALEIMAEEGIHVDSSIFPTRHDRYGIPGAKLGIHVRRTPSGSLVEFPPTVASLGRMRLPVAGGGYFRLYPLPLTRLAMQRVQRSGRPVMFYVHPWEIDPQQPRLSAGSYLSRLRHYVNLHSTWDKLDRLLGDFAFGTVSQVLAENAKGIRVQGFRMAEPEPRTAER
jgi:polysaccharide deacetylase family protein (PEP-CTERM system associated)